MNITKIQDIWTYICVEFFLIQGNDEDPNEEDEDDEHVHLISGFFLFLIKKIF